MSKIIYRKGCLIKAFKSGAFTAMAHQANCFNTMGAGIAKAIRREFPQVYEADCQTTKGDKAKLGSLTWTITEYGPVFNLYGQYRYGRDKKYTDEVKLLEAMDTMSLFLGFDAELREEDGLPPPSIGMPRIGAGLAGGDWDMIEAGIEEILCKDYDVFVYEL